MSSWMSAPDGFISATVALQDWRVDLIGTAHISRTSVEQVGALVSSGNYDVVALELCPARLRSLLQGESNLDLDLLKVLRSGRAGLVASTLALSATQQRMATRLGIEAGAEMRAAHDRAEQAGVPLLLVDRDVNVTLARAYRSLGFLQRTKVMFGLVSSVLAVPDVSAEEVEELKNGDILSDLFSEVAQEVPGLFRTLVEERDHFMAARMREELPRHAGSRALLVVGAGHIRGITQALPDDTDPAEEIATLNLVPPKKRRLRWLTWMVVLVILAGFAYGFSVNSELGWSLVRDWVVINGSLSALGAAIAGGHAFTIFMAFLAAPFTSLNPTVGAGMVAGAAELYVRRPTIGEFQNLRTDIEQLRGWRQNGVARVLGVFVLSSLGSALGTYVAGARLIEVLFT